MMELKFYNTLERAVVPFHAIRDAQVGMYTCGPTVYNYAHIGNFRAYIFEDLLHRVLNYAGYDVTQVMNLTDVDDKTIRDSRASGKPLSVFTKTYIDAFFQDLKTLNITPAKVYPAATKHIPEMIQMIQTLLDKNYAYQASDRSIYFAINKFPSYGKLARIDRENQRDGVRISTDEYAKESVGDFALWKAWDEKDGDVRWDSPWGPGRPGWHIECSAMSMKYLGKTFDLHTGGIDNMFPHHEDEIAQSECANGCRSVNYWLHCAHLMVDGEKMSKSLGNFYTLRDLLSKGWSGRELRMVLTGCHYRKQLNFTFDALAQAREHLRRFDDFFRRLHEACAPADAPTLEPLLLEAKTAFDREISDDLNIAGGLAAVFDLTRDLNKLLEAGSLSKSDAAKALALFAEFDQVLGYLDVGKSAAAEIPLEIQALADARFAAKKVKNYAEADRCREELKAHGYAVEDTPAFCRVKKL
ncbi:MAG: cysteine--tRNA ligase [Victivallaceae bacterium]|nr:cysteine--tRNA ligase [Victivallaceae bacterium]